MADESISATSTRIGDHPRLGAVTIGVVGLVGGLVGGRAGSWIALVLLGPTKIEDPWNLVGNSILIIVPLAVWAVGALVGFTAGVVAAAVVTMAMLRWDHAGATIVGLILIEIVAVPAAAWLTLRIGAASESAGWVALWSAAFVVGGVVPALARWLAVRRHGPVGGSLATDAADPTAPR